MQTVRNQRMWHCYQARQNTGPKALHEITATKGHFIMLEDVTDNDYITST